MFKKKNLKKDNVLEDVLKTGDDEEQNSDGNTNEPVVKKKVKRVDFKYSTKAQTEEYEKIVNEYADDLKYKARPDLITKNNGNAFATLEINTDHHNDTKAMKLRQMEISKLKKEGKLDGKYYLGESGYAVYAEKSEKDIHNSKYTGSLGPIRGPSNVRASCRFDYNPSLCKDWHETGYCGFGDSCIFIHDRTDYKSGWELEKEWEKEQAEKAKKLSVTTSGIQNNADEEEQEEEDDGLPKKCQACEEDFKSPVVTSCKHYFCEKCIMQKYKDDRSCPVCSAILNGNFNIAKDIIAKLGLDLKNASKTKKQNRIKIGEKNEKLKEDSEDDEEQDGLEGVDFGDRKPAKDKGKSFEKVAAEFKKSLGNSKEKFQSETDWMY